MSPTPVAPRQGQRKGALKTGPLIPPTPCPRNLMLVEMCPLRWRKCVHCLKTHHYNYAIQCKNKHVHFLDETTSCIYCTYISISFLKCDSKTYVLKLTEANAQC